MGGALAWATFESDLLRATLVAGERGLRRVHLWSGAIVDPERELRGWAARQPDEPRLERDERALAGARRELGEYVEGSRRSFRAALDPRGTAFQRRVWSALQGIGYGEIASYGAIARRVGSPGAARAVGAANGANPLPIFVPCHRVVATGSIGGFSPGLALKRALLAHEGVSDAEHGA